VYFLQKKGLGSLGVKEESQLSEVEEGEQNI